ncbi:MAG TPA: hypothetical protein VL119_07035, partial [Acidimicrobiia bacterium]|nr:hypothetical protein [Acidimicrobiia bacterium]
SADDTHDLASLLLDCIGIARLSAFDAHVTLSSKERSCIDALARRDPDAVKAIANLIGGSGDVVAPLEHLHARSAACLTPAHLAQLGGTG